MSDQPVQKKRLSDQILEALKQAVDQENHEVAELLSRALELAMRAPKPGGSGEAIEERRDYPEEIESFLRIFDEMKDKPGGY